MILSWFLGLIFWRRNSWSRCLVDLRHNIILLMNRIAWFISKMLVMLGWQLNISSKRILLLNLKYNKTKTHFKTNILSNSPQRHGSNSNPINTLITSTNSTNNNTPGDSMSDSQPRKRNNSESTNNHFSTISTNLVRRFGKVEC